MRSLDVDLAEHFCGGTGNAEEIHIGGLEELLRQHPIKELQQGIVEPVLVPVRHHRPRAVRLRIAERVPTENSAGLKSVPPVEARPAPVIPLAPTALRRSPE